MYPGSDVNSVFIFAYSKHGSDRKFVKKLVSEI
jgi:hypothetical protein